MLELKVDPNFPHHYFIGVDIMSAQSRTPGKLYLKYGPVYFTNDDVKNVQMACDMMDDKIYKQIYKVSRDDIFKIAGCTEIIMTMTALKFAGDANRTSFHHFSTEFEMDDADSFFKGMVDRANDFNSHDRRKLDAARIRI
jgi:hypothetical protein